MILFSCLKLKRNMKFITVLLGFAVLILVVVPVIVSIVPSTPLCTSDKSCKNLNQTLKTTSLVLLLLMLLTLLPAIYFIVQEMRSKESIPNPKSNKFLMIGLASMVSLFAIVTPLLNRIAKNVDRYVHYPPRDDCPFYWKKTINEDGSYSCQSTLETNKEAITVYTKNDPQQRGTEAYELIKKEKVFWDGFYNGGYIDNL